ncbi:MAG: hypothetical protein ABIK20_03525 [Candidatus Omnitrophota bacterium]
MKIRYLVNNPVELRKSHFREFAKLPADVQIRWALEQGYFLQNLLPKKLKKITSHFRHGKKKTFLFRRITGSS